MSAAGAPAPMSTVWVGSPDGDRWAWTAYRTVPTAHADRCADAMRRRHVTLGTAARRRVLALPAGQEPRP